jgi:hypothetical protein
MVATPSSVIVTADYAANIVSLSHTHQVISLKLKKHQLSILTNADEAISPRQGIFIFVDGSNSCL